MDEKNYRSLEKKKVRTILNIYKDVIVNKPWGYEYLIYENDNVGIWWLEISPQSKTSLHCHPDKKTGLILLQGNAKIQFLSSVTYLNGFDKVLIREGFFHSTENLTINPISVIEVETPKNKENLVRLEDAYGRKLTHYEGNGSFKERNNELLWIEDILGYTTVYNGFTFTVDILSEELISMLDSKYEYFVVLLSPVGISTKNENIPISKIGDVLTHSSLKKLLTEFKINDNTKVLTITK